MKKNYYGIKVGRRSNIVVDTWDKCSALVTGHKGAIFKGFIFEDEAIKFAGKPKKKVESKPDDAGSKPEPMIYTVVNRKPECIERKSYKDPYSGIYYKNRCVRRYYATTIGNDYA